jgi:hypothetical protein
MDGPFGGQQRSASPLANSLTRWLSAFCPDTSLWPLREERAMRLAAGKDHEALQGTLLLSQLI